MRIEYTCPVSLIPIPLVQWQYFLERKKAMESIDFSPYVSRRE